MESRNPKLHRSDIERNMPPLRGFSWFGGGTYKDVAPLELKSPRRSNSHLAAVQALEIIKIELLADCLDRT
jgi:hypothetical protein